MRTPKLGDEVAVPSHTGAFRVSAVRTGPDVVDLELIGPAEYTEKNVPWGVLVYLNKPREDVNQAAARIVKEATEQN